MQKKPILAISFLLCFLSAQAAIFYIDPNSGDINNDGSFNMPWSTLEEVFDSGLIESQKYSPLPYDPVISQLIPSNVGAPVKAGDTLYLRSGLHGNVFARNYHNSANIRIMAQAGHTPILMAVRMQSCSNWDFDGITVSSEPYGTYINYHLVYFETHGHHGPSSKMSLSNSHIFSTATPWTLAEDWVTKASSGIYVDGDSCLIFNNKLENVDHGITLLASHLSAINNEIINFSGDGMRMNGSHSLIESNLIKNCYDVDDNHDDGIQSFVIGEGSWDYNTIRSNVILNYDDPNQPLRGTLQGIGCFDGFYNNWVIENNLIFTDHYHGISLYGANDCTIINNTVLDPTPDIAPGAIWIRITDHKNGTPSSGCIVKNNISNRIIVDATESHNIELLDYSDYDEHFADYSQNDFHLKMNSSLIDAGDNTGAPNFDLDGISRPQGSHVDIGCFEFVALSSNADVINGIDDIVLFPNPAIGEFTIKGLLDDYHLDILDMNGNVFQNIDTSANVQTIILDGLPNGMFFVRIQHKTLGDLKLEKIIKL